MDELRRRYEEYKEEGQTFEEFIPSWCGAQQNSEGVWGRYTNPNSKWDWWTIGGRWSGLLMLKPEAYGQGENGHGGVLNRANSDPKFADSALSKQIDWEGMRQREIRKSQERGYADHGWQRQLL